VYLTPRGRGARSTTSCRPTGGNTPICSIRTKRYLHLSGSVWTDTWSPKQWGIPDGFAFGKKPPSALGNPFEATLMIALGRIPPIEGNNPGPSRKRTIPTAYSNSRYRPEAAGRQSTTSSRFSGTESRLGHRRPAHVVAKACYGTPCSRNTFRLVSASESTYVTSSTRYSSGTRSSLHLAMAAYTCDARIPEPQRTSYRSLAPGLRATR
jgi:hypothetical protein